MEKYIIDRQFHDSKFQRRGDILTSHIIETSPQTGPHTAPQRDVHQPSSCVYGYTSSTTRVPEGMDRTRHIGEPVGLQQISGSGALGTPAIFRSRVPLIGASVGGNLRICASIVSPGFLISATNPVVRLRMSSTCVFSRPVVALDFS